jgi:fructose-1,6-bisphosphatase/inositol monophosphatase family enzyme
MQIATTSGGYPQQIAISSERTLRTMKKALLALFVALVMGVTTFGVIETTYAQEQPTADSGSGMTKTAKKKRRRRKKRKAESSPSGFITANRF